MAGEHVILLDEQDQPAGMLEKYAAHTFDTLYISRFPAGCLTSRVSYWSLAVRWAKSLARGMDQLGLRTPQQGETFEQAVTRRCRFEPVWRSRYRAGSPGLPLPGGRPKRYR